MNFDFSLKLRVNFKYQSLSDVPFEFTPAHIGQWRLTLMGEFGDEDGKKECVRIRFDLAEDLLKT